jgi:hypothetical protein
MTGVFVHHLTNCDELHPMKHHIFKYLGEQNGIDVLLDDR